MNASDRIRVLIVDDHPMVRKGLSAFLEVIPGLEEVGVAANGAEAIRLGRKCEPDVILMDLVMPEVDGVEAIRRIKETQPHVKIIAMTSFQEEELVRRAFEAGATSYLMKDVSLENLEAAIRAAHHGEPTLSPEATRVLIRRSAPTSGPKFGLTPRELQVLALLVEGLNNREIADRLAISRATASVHVSNIFSKLGVSNRVEATSLALRNKLAG
jgi:two-component system, NarL family, response regulator LiaR